MPSRAQGPFDVKVTPQSASTELTAAKLGRMSLDKQYHGMLDATAVGEMLTAATDVQGSGVYVAVERVTGSLDGRRGTFALMHNGVMVRNTPQLTITVIPDSGTGELAGLTGTMAIEFGDGGKHFYNFEYTITAHR